MKHAKQPKRNPLALAVILAALVLAACSSPVEFTINFVSDGAVYKTVGTNGSETIKLPDDPVKDGFEFDGWFWNEGDWKKPFTANSLLDAPLSFNITVYAKWKTVFSLTGTQAAFAGFQKIDDDTYSVKVSNAGVDKPC